MNTLARERGFAVQDVPRDGNCLFSAVCMQLENVGIQLGEINLRVELVEHLQTHPYTHGSAFNADTEAPTEEDEFISSTEDPELQQQLRWLRYLGRLNVGAWEDDIAVQGLADMLHVDIHVISTINPDMDLIRVSQ